MSTFERRVSQHLAQDRGRLRVGCSACDFVGDLAVINIRANEDMIHALPCPKCKQVGGMHEYPVAGTWPSEYANNRCPLDDETQSAASADASSRNLDKPW